MDPKKGLLAVIVLSVALTLIHIIFWTWGFDATTMFVSQKDASPEKLELVLFTTWPDDAATWKAKWPATRNVLHAWRMWRPWIRPLVFTGNTTVARIARDYGWDTLPVPKFACGGVPVLREMYRTAMAKYNDTELFGYINGDLVFDDGLLTTVSALFTNKTIMAKPLLAVIERFNVDFAGRAPLKDVSSLSSIANQGKRMDDGSSDGFLTNRLFPWDHMPDIVVGHLAVDMFVVAYAKEMGVQVIDVTDTALAVHQTVTQYGNREALYKTNSVCVREMISNLGATPNNWVCGFIQCTEFKTTRSTGTQGSRKVLILKRDTTVGQCSECLYTDLSRLNNTIF